MPYVTYSRDGSSQVLTPDQADDLEDILAHDRTRSSLRYGWRRTLGCHGGQRPCHHEQLVLARIRELRAIGWGAMRIAHYLDTTAYRPRGRRGNQAWNIDTVHGLIKRIDAENRASSTSPAT